MADNRMYLVHEPSGLAVFIGKRHGFEYVLSDTGDRVESINALYDAAYDYCKGNWGPDEFRIGLEDDEDYLSKQTPIDSEIALIESVGEHLELVRFLNRHLEQD